MGAVGGDTRRFLCIGSLVSHPGPPDRVHTTRMCRSDCVTRKAEKNKLPLQQQQVSLNFSFYTLHLHKHIAFVFPILVAC